MKSKDYVQELNGLTTDKLLDREKELKEQLFNLRFQLATGQLENTASLKSVRTLHGLRQFFVNNN